MDDKISRNCKKKNTADTQAQVCTNQTRKKLIQYLVDVLESLNCPVNDLIKNNIFNSMDEIKNFVENLDHNFCILKKIDQEEHLFFIPVRIRQSFIIDFTSFRSFQIYF
jgi:hypothetical protein